MLILLRTILSKGVCIILIPCSYILYADCVTTTLLLTCFVCTRAEIGSTSMLCSMAIFLPWSILIRYGRYLIFLLDVFNLCNRGQILWMALSRLSLPRMKLLRLMPLQKRERKKVYICTRFCSLVINLDKIRHNRRVLRSVLTLSWICEWCYREGCTWVLAYCNEDKWGFGHAGEFKSTLRFPAYFLAFPSPSVMFGVWLGTRKMFYCYTIFDLCIGQGCLTDFHHLLTDHWAWWSRSESFEGY